MLTSATTWLRVRDGAAGYEVGYFKGDGADAGAARQGRGTVVTGRIEAGRIRVGDEVEIVGLASAARKSVVTGVEMFKSGCCSAHRPLLPPRCPSAWSRGWHVFPMAAACMLWAPLRAGGPWRRAGRATTWACCCAAPGRTRCSAARCACCRRSSDLATPAWLPVTPGAHTRVFVADRPTGVARRESVRRALC